MFVAGALSASCATTSPYGPHASAILIAYKQDTIKSISGEQKRRFNRVDISSTDAANLKALALLAADRAVRICAPTAFDIANLTEVAVNLRRVAPIVDDESAQTALGYHETGLMDAYVREKNGKPLGFYGDGPAHQKADQSIRAAAFALTNALAIKSDRVNKKSRSAENSKIRLVLRAAAFCCVTASQPLTEYKKDLQEKNNTTPAEEAIVAEHERLRLAVVDLLVDLVKVARGRAVQDIVPAIDPKLLVVVEDCSQPDADSDGKPDYNGCLSKLLAEARYQEVIEACKLEDVDTDKMNQDKLRACYPHRIAALFLSEELMQSREMMTNWCNLKGFGAKRKPGPRIRESRAAEVNCILHQAYRSPNTKVDEQNKQFLLESAPIILSKVCRIRRGRLIRATKRSCID